MTTQQITIPLATLEQLVEAAEELMEWQVKSVKVWHNSAYDTMDMRLTTIRAAIDGAQRVEREPIFTIQHCKENANV